MAEVEHANKYVMRLSSLSYYKVFPSEIKIKKNKSEIKVLLGFENILKMFETIFYKNSE